MTHVQFIPAQRLAGITVSPIMSLLAQAAELKRAGRPVINLSAGEPDFDTPDHIKDAAIRAMKEGATKYTPTDGLPAFKEAVADKFRRDNNLNPKLDEIIVSPGAKHVLFNAMAATLDSGDEVIIPSPFWVTYADIVRLCGGRPILVPTHAESGFRLTAEQLERAITSQTRWLMLNSPSNPSGAAYTAEDYRLLLDVLSRHPRVWLLADDIYEHIVYDGFRFVTPAQLNTEVALRTLTVNGLSKAYSMTGWRVGYAAGPKALIKAMVAVQSQTATCAPSIGQVAGIAALAGPQEVLRERCAEFAKRRDLMVAGLNAIPGLSCRKPEGAFYILVNCERLYERRSPSGSVIVDDQEFCRYLLRDIDVAVVPGAAFGLSGHFRLSYAASLSELSEALRRLQRGCELLV